MKKIDYLILIPAALVVVAAVLVVMFLFGGNSKPVLPCHFERGECPNENCQNYGRKAGERIERITIEHPDRISVLFNNGAYDFLTREEFTKETGIVIDGPFFEQWVPAVSYRAGEVLYPDMVHPDTLVVVDAKRLTHLMNSPDMGSDGDIAEALGEYTIPIEDVRADSGYYHAIFRKQNSQPLNYNYSN